MSWNRFLYSRYYLDPCHRVLLRDTAAGPCSALQSAGARVIGGVMHPNEPEGAGNSDSASIKRCTQSDRGGSVDR